MAEALITRRSGTGRASSGKLVIETIVENTNWKIPSNVVDNKFSVMIFGGGGGGGVRNSFSYDLGGGGGGGGWMNNRSIEINYGGSVLITLGAGGDAGDAGGTSSFGTYLSANGGSAGGGGHSGAGGNGGSGGGGGLYVSTNHPRGLVLMLDDGGKGYQFGGGSNFIREEWSNYGSITNTYRGTVYEGSANLAGYGGDGSRNSSGKNGTNTIGDNNVEERLQGAGLGSNKVYSSNYNSNTIGYGGSGGGYGGNAGHRTTSSYSTATASADIWSSSTDDVKNRGWVYYYSPGGGGGYGGNGGNSNNLGAGGGGYGGKGGNGSSVAGGGGGYGNGGEERGNPGFGGGGCTNNKGGQGICIIEYYSLNS